MHDRSTFGGDEVSIRPLEDLEGEMEIVLSQHGDDFLIGLSADGDGPDDPGMNSLMRFDLAGLDAMIESLTYLKKYGTFAGIA